jgi:hypothetical protein
VTNERETIENDRNILENNNGVNTYLDNLRIETKKLDRGTEIGAPPP